MASPVAPTPVTVHLVRGEHFSVPSRYRDLRHLGSGAYGSVCAAVDTHTGRCVADGARRPARAAELHEHCRPGGVGMEARRAAPTAAATVS